MHSFRRLALLLALASPVVPAVLAQSPSHALPAESSSLELLAQNQAPSLAQQPGETPQQLSVQERIRMRRAQRRATAIHDAYDHLYEAYLGMGYLRFTPGPDLQRLTYYAWNTGVTRFYSERSGITVDARGYYGTAYVGLNPSNITRPSVSQYDIMAGPTYRFYLQPKYSISGRVMAGWALGDFSGDTSSFGPKQLGLYPDGSTFAVNAGVQMDYNLTPNFALRLGPDYQATGFGSTMQNSLGFSGGMVLRFGKQ